MPPEGFPKGALLDMTAPTTDHDVSLRPRSDSRQKRPDASPSTGAQMKASFSRTEGARSRIRFRQQ